MKSALYVASNATSAVAAGGAIPLGNVVHRCGCACDLTTNGIVLKSNGYYDMVVNLTLLGGSAAGNVTFTIYQDGVAIPTTATTVSLAATSYANVTVPVLLRNTKCCGASTITIVATDAMSVTGVDIVVDKE